MRVSDNSSSLDEKIIQAESSLFPSSLFLLLFGRLSQHFSVLLYSIVSLLQAILPWITYSLAVLKECLEYSWERESREYKRQLRNFV
jgi:hypothetical protein